MHGRAGFKCAFTVAAIAAALSVEVCAAAEVTQYFPISRPGAPPARPETGWRIRYEILPAGTHNYGGSAVWEIQSAEFMRGYTSAGQENWIKILNNLALVEMYVPYYDGYEIYDISEYGFDFVGADASYIPTAGVISGQVLQDGVVISERVDDSVRWMDTQDRVRRGQALDLWATLDAANYRYVIKYRFADDGSIQARAGGTAQNLRSVPIGDHQGIHLHSPAWRLEFDLGAAAANQIHVVERQHDPQSAAADLTHRAFANGLEGGELWNAEKFTTLMVSNAQTKNAHNPPSEIGYKLSSLRSGSLRTFREHTKFDFWVTRTAPSAANRIAALERQFVEIADYVRNPEPIDGQPVAIWHTTALHHVPRTEDFGADGYVAGDGLAIMMWTGFDLMPHNLWDKTPLYPAIP